MAIDPQPFNQRKRQSLVKLLSISAIAVMLVSQPGWPGWSSLHEGLETAGAPLILVCMFGRLSSTLNIGTRMNSELDMVGPYSITRNPLYLFSIIGVFGLGLVFGSIVAAFALAGLSHLVLSIAADKEAAFLRTWFAAKYPAYEARTPQLWPDVRLYHAPSEMTSSPRVLQRALGDALYFLALIPVIECVEYLQASGYLPVFFWFP